MSLSLKKTCLFWHTVIINLQFMLTHLSNTMFLSCAPLLLCTTLTNAFWKSTNTAAPDSPLHVMPLEKKLGFAILSFSKWLTISYLITWMIQHFANNKVEKEVQQHIIPWAHVWTSLYKSIPIYKLSFNRMLHLHKRYADKWRWLEAWDTMLTEYGICKLWVMTIRL